MTSERFCRRAACKNVFDCCQSERILCWNGKNKEKVERRKEGKNSNAKPGKKYARRTLDSSTFARTLIALTRCREKNHPLHLDPEAFTPYSGTYMPFSTGLTWMFSFRRPEKSRQLTWLTRKSNRSYRTRNRELMCKHSNCVWNIGINAFTQIDLLVMWRRVKYWDNCVHTGRLTRNVKW